MGKAPSSNRITDDCETSVLTCANQFASPAEAQASIEALRVDNNQPRHHSSLGHLTPNGFIAQRQVIRSVEEAICLVKNCSLRSQRHAQEISTAC